MPKVSQWHERQIEIAGEASKYEAAIQSLTGSADFDAFEKPAEEDPNSENGLIVIGVRHALLANSALENVALSEISLLLPSSPFPLILWNSRETRVSLRNS